jgi:DUF4097 and DUF4098 domain-containing protein YvlB
MAHTAEDLIDVLHAGGLVKAQTAAGYIKVASARSADLQSAAGAIQLRGVSGALNVSTASGNILTELLAGSRLDNSFLNTGRGDITVFIPSNLAVTVEAHNESWGGLEKIVSDFPEIRVRLEQMRRARQAIAEGTLNGGGPVLRISATGGTIYLRRQK